jgi:integrase
MNHKLMRWVSYGKDHNGKRLRKRFYGDTKIELEMNIAKFLTAYEKRTSPSAVTFGAYAEQWMDTYKSNRSTNTKEMYREALKKCAPISPVAMQAITRSDCQGIINEVWDMPRTAQIVRLLLKQVFDAAVEDGIVNESPAARLEIPKNKKAEKRLLTEEEIEAVRNAPLSEMDRMFVNLMLVFGLRPGEALALTKKDFDLDAMVLHVTKSLELPNQAPPKLKDTKTGSTRDIPVPDAFRTLLEGYKLPKKTSFLIHQENGHPMTKSSYRRLCDRVLKAAGNPTGMTMYSFRHYRATQLYYLTQQGKISTKKAAYLMGHSEKMFLDVYSHIDENKEDSSVLYDGIKV